MADTKGVIYILTNPSFPDYVKIGYGCIRAYWDTGSQRVLFEAVFDDEWNRYLYINGHEVF